MDISKVNIKEKFSLFSDYFNPRIVGELNGQQVKLVKTNGEFVWHKRKKTWKGFRFQCADVQMCRCANSLCGKP